MICLENSYYEKCEKRIHCKISHLVRTEHELTQRERYELVELEIEDGYQVVLLYQARIVTNKEVKTFKTMLKHTTKVESFV